MSSCSVIESTRKNEAVGHIEAEVDSIASEGVIGERKSTRSQGSRDSRRLRVVAAHDSAAGVYIGHGLDPSTVIESLDSVSIRSDRNGGRVTGISELTSNAIDASE